MDSSNIVFQPHLSFLVIILRKVKSLLFWGVVCLLVFIGGYGISFLIFYYFFYGVERIGEFLNIFYWTVFADMLLFYIWNRRQETMVRIGEAIPETQIESSDFLAESLRDDLDKTWLFCYRKGYHYMRPVHLFYTFLYRKEFKEILRRLDSSPDEVIQKTKTILKSSKFFPESKKSINIFGPQIAADFKRIFVVAYLNCLQDKRKQITFPDVLLAMGKENNLVGMIFDEFGISSEEIQAVASWVIVEDEIKREQKSYIWKKLLKPKGKLDRAMTASLTPLLDRMSRDLTFLAREKAFEYIVGREKEIEDIFSFFASGQPAVVLVGGSKVGKKAVLKKIAQLMVAEDVPVFLQDKRLVQLDIESLVGMKESRERGEEYLKSALSEVNHAGNIILVIENIDSLVGLRANQSGLEFAEILSLALNNKAFYFIGTASKDGFAKIENTSLGHALNKIDLADPSRNLIRLILISKICFLERKLKVLFSVDALDEAVNLADRYLYGKALTAKAMDLLIEAAYKKSSEPGKKSLIRRADIAKLVTEKTKVPLGEIETTHRDKLLNLEKIIHQRLINQDEAVNAVASSLRRSQLRPEGGKKPIANFLFVGPTGVGKTELAKTLAWAYFGDEKRMIRLDMSEYQEQRSLRRLIGMKTERGIEKGYLTEAVKRQPFSLLLLDELEKAHKDVLNVFLQVMDDGRLTDVSGETINFNNVIIIATSNAGTKFVQEKISEGVPYEEISYQLKYKVLLDHFRPEFLNRFDNVVLFRPLSMEHLVMITYLFLREIKDRLEERGIIFEAEQEAAEELAKGGFDPVFGARYLKRTIQEKVEDSIAKIILEEKAVRRDRIILRKGLVLDVEKAMRL